MTIVRRLRWHLTEFAEWCDHVLDLSQSRGEPGIIKKTSYKDCSYTMYMVTAWKANVSFFLTEKRKSIPAETVLVFSRYTNDNLRINKNYCMYIPWYPQWRHLRWWFWGRKSICTRCPLRSWLTLSRPSLLSGPRELILQPKAELARPENKQFKFSFTVDIKNHT
jgi:hypothetical protein